MLSKRGYCSRTAAQSLIESGRVRVDGRVVRDAETRIALDHANIEVDGQAIGSSERAYLMLNKPRGLVTTTRDEHGRNTVYACLQDPALPWLSPVGRLDKASEGLLLLSNDTAWADAILDPARHLDKTYHVQINRIADGSLLAAMTAGVDDGSGNPLAAKHVTVLRSGSRNSWLEIVLDEGRNRQIRRLLAALGIDVLRLLRVAIGPLPLGNLPKGAYRRLTTEEVRALAAPTPASMRRQ